MISQQHLVLPGYDWLGNGTSAIAVIVFINTWQFVGVSMVIYLAGIQGVSQSYLEAATVDGANAWERFRFIILPLLVPALSSSVIYNLIGGLKLYDVIIALTDGGPAKKTHLWRHILQTDILMQNVQVCSSNWCIFLCDDYDYFHDCQCIFP